MHEPRRGRKGAFRAKALNILIVSGLAASFQLLAQINLPANAAGKLPVMQFAASAAADAGSTADLVRMLTALEPQSGYAPWTIREQDFALNITPDNTPQVIVPLGSAIGDATFARLSQYVADGGRLILVSGGEAPNSDTERLCRLIGLNLTGFGFVSRPLPLHWKDSALPTQDSLPVGSRILIFDRDFQTSTLATWGNDFPAILNTGHGAVLNWPKAPPSTETIALALSKVIPFEEAPPINTPAAAPTEPPQVEPNAPQTSANGRQTESIANAATGISPIFHEAIARAEAARKAMAAFSTKPEMALKEPVPLPELAISESASALAQPDENTSPAASEAEPPATIQPETKEAPSETKTTEASDIPQTLSAPSAPVAETVKTPSTSTSAPVITTEPAPEASAATPVPPTSVPIENKPVETPKTPEPVPATKPAAAPAMVQTPPADKAPAPAKPVAAPTLQDAAEDEALQNILGTSPADEEKSGASDPMLDDKMDEAGAEVDEAPRKKTGGEAGQKHFSFLDPEARDVLAPEFDYGVYSMNMRILEDYKQHIMDALETAHQLDLQIPEARVRELMAESDRYKSTFGSLYLSNRVADGLDAYGQARQRILQAIALTSVSPRVEGRAIWLDRGSIVDAANPAGIQRLFQKLQQAGINVVYFETFNAGFPIYPSKLVKENPLIAPGWDPLKAAVEEGHKLGMEVHAWVWCFAVGNRRHNDLIGQPDDYPGPVLGEAGLMDEALRNRNGGIRVDNRQKEYWLSPASPRGRQFLLDVYKEIVTNYDVDGLHLDYIRYPFQTSGNRMGYEAVGRERFEKATGLSLDSMNDTSAKLWIAWKTYQVSSFVQQVSETMRALKPDIKISAAVFPMHRESRIIAIQQDWETWVDNGWVDVLNPMSYTTDPARLQRMFEYVQNSPTRHTIIYPGVAMHRLDGGRLVLELEALREKGGLGATLFANTHLNPEKIEALGTGPFRTPNSLPPHRNVVKALQWMLADYDQKLTKVSSGNAATPADSQTVAIREAVQDLTGTLNAIGSSKPIATIPTSQIQSAQAQFKTLQGLNTAWTTADKQAHPFRAQYFDQVILQLDELMGYLGDQSAIAASGSRNATATFKQDNNSRTVPPPPVTATINAPPAVGNVLPASNTPVTENPATDDLAPEEDDAPIAN